MAWWTKIRGEVKKHDGRSPKMAAAIELNFAHHVSDVPHSEMGLYKRDPSKYPDEPNMLPAEMEKVRKRMAKKGGR